MMVTFVTGEELTQGVAKVTAFPVYPQEGEEPASFLNEGDFDEQEHDARMLAREIASHAGSHAEAEAQRIVAEALAKAKSEHVRNANPRLALNHLANWR